MISIANAQPCSCSQSLLLLQTLHLFAYTSETSSWLSSKVRLCWAHLQADRLEYLGVAIRGSTEGLVGAASATASRAQQSPATPALHQQSHEPPTSGTEQQGQGVVEALQAYMSLPAVAQLAGQLKVLLSGQMKEQCQDVQVWPHSVVDSCQHQLSDPAQQLLPASAELHSRCLIEDCQSLWIFLWPGCCSNIFPQNMLAVCCVDACVPTHLADLQPATICSCEQSALCGNTHAAK